MTSRKRVGLVAGAGVGAAAAAALRRAWARRSAGEEAEPGELSAAARSYLDHLGAAVRIPTVSHEDPGDDDQAAFARFREFLADTYPLAHRHLDVESVAVRSLLFRWPGADPDAEPILLLSHQDVVPVETGTETDWEQDPFSGEADERHLWGRGTLDDKGSLIGIMEAVESLLGAGFVPDTTLYLAMGHDEEVGGTGAAAIAALLVERGVRLEFVLDEGGAIGEDLLPGIAGPLALVGIGEKGAVNVELVARGDGGHSSTPPAHTAVGRVAAAIAAIEGAPMPARLEVQAPFFSAVAGVLPAPMRLVLRASWVTRRLLERRLSAGPMTNALIRTTAAATMVAGGVKSNVLPQEARAVVNFRVLPGDTIEGVLEHVRSVVGGDVQVGLAGGGIRSEPPPLSDPASAAFGLVAETIAEVFPDVVTIAPWILMGATDARQFSEVAGQCLRFAPFRASPADMGRVHGTNERIRVSDADGVVRFYKALIRNACGTG